MCRPSLDRRHSVRNSTHTSSACALAVLFAAASDLMALSFASAVLCVCLILVKAAFSNSLHIMSLLVQAGADVNLQCVDGRTALAIAGQNNNLKVVQFLAEQGKANLDLQNNEGRTAMHLAAEKGCLMVVEYLTRAGADYNIKDNAGITVHDVPDRTSGGTAADMRRNVEAAVQRGLAAAQAAAAELEAQEQAAREKAEQEAEEGGANKDGDKDAAEAAAAAAEVPADPAAEPQA